MIKAKRIVEEVMDLGKATVLIPMVESLGVPIDELESFGIHASPVGLRLVDVRLLRERLGLTQEEFALQYGLELDAVRNWEHGRREPNTAAKSYLRVIERIPEQIRAALAEP